MTRRLRKTFIAGAVLLGFAITLVLQLNALDLNARVKAEIKQYPSLHMQVEKTSLTFMHGIGVRLDQVSIEHADFHVKASHITVSMHLLPLLIGHVKVKALDIHDAVFKLTSDSLAIGTASISELPIQRIRLLRSRIEAADGTTLLNNMQLELRGLGSEHEMLWELAAKQAQQTVSGHGRILFQHGEIESGFSKLKLANLPVDSLHSVAPATLMNWIEGDGNTLSGSLTIDITKHHTWAVFGELALANTAQHMKAKLRGKLSHPSDGLLIWKDSFIQLDGQAVIAIVGSCQQQHCSTSLDAKNIALARWYPFIPSSITFHRLVSGRSHLLASLQWDDKAWQSKAVLTLKKLHFLYNKQRIKLPDLSMDLYELSGTAKTWKTKATITSPNIDGSFSILGNRASNGDKSMEVNTKNADSQLWLPLSNLLLASLKMQPMLQAQGNIQGSLHLHQHSLHQHGIHQTLELNVDASSAEINYKPWFNKAANITAICNATMKLANNSTFSAIDLSQCQLGTAHIDKLTWSKKLQSHALSVKNASIDIDQLRTLSIPLPPSLASLQGHIQGSGSTRWTTRVKWLDKLYGNWTLNNLGDQTWLANGKISVNHGIFSSQLINIHGDYGKADIQGNYDMSKQHGNINILSSALDWGTMPTPPAWWNHITLQGEIQHSELTLLHNNWHDLHSNYQLHQGALTLQSLRSNIAGGLISSDSISLSPDQEGLAIQGKLHVKQLQLDQLHGLATWVNADMHGTLQANVSLYGHLSPHTASDITPTAPTRPWQSTWQHSNGDVLIYSGDWMQHTPDEASPSNRYAFKKLEFRFRMHKNKTAISNITLLSHGQSYHGKANISPDFRFDGALQDSSDQSLYRIYSTLPKISWGNQ